MKKHKYHSIDDIVLHIVKCKLTGDEWVIPTVTELQRHHPKIYKEYEIWVHGLVAKKYSNAGASASTFTYVHTPLLLKPEKEAKIIELLKKHCTLQNINL